MEYSRLGVKITDFGLTFLFWRGYCFSCEVINISLAGEIDAWSGLYFTRYAARFGNARLTEENNRFYRH